MPATTYRQATRDDLDIAVEWAAAEGWNPGLADADVFWTTDPNGFVCAERAGEVIATGSVVSYGGNFGFMGFFIVRPDLRGNGVGREFWYWRRNLLVDRLKPNTPIGLDGVFDLQPFYASGGFEFSHRTVRMAGTGTAAERDPNLVELSTLPFGAVATFDQRHFGISREQFLRSWISPRSGLGLAALHGEEIAAMGVVRPCRNGFKIGPLFANSPDLAQSLFASLSSFAAGRPIFLDTPENNAAALALAERHGMTEVFGCARMYYGPAPALPWDDIYGVTTFELG
jgi:GNAT superfamily N-acetyltransferase